MDIAGRSYMLITPESYRVNHLSMHTLSMIFLLQEACLRKGCTINFILCSRNYKKGKENHCWNVKSRILILFLSSKALQRGLKNQNLVKEEHITLQNTKHSDERTSLPFLGQGRETLKKDRHNCLV